MNVRYRSFSRPPLRCVEKSAKFAHVHWVVGKWEPFWKGDVVTKWFSFTNHPMRIRGFCYATQCRPRPWKRSISDMIPLKLQCFLLLFTENERWRWGEKSRVSNFEDVILAGLQIEGIFYAFKMPKTHWRWCRGTSNTFFKKKKCIFILP
jgi:hypothetical protein